MQHSIEACIRCIAPVSQKEMARGGAILEKTRRHQDEALKVGPSETYNPSQERSIFHLAQMAREATEIFPTTQ